MSRAADGTHKRWTSWYTRRVTYVLADHEGNIVLVPAHMKIRLRKAEWDRNIYEGAIRQGWLTLTNEHRLLALKGVLYADNRREFVGRIDWVVEVDPKAARSVSASAGDPTMPAARPAAG